MPDFLTNVVTTHLGQHKLIEPRRPARFEPNATLGEDPLLNINLNPDDTVNLAAGVPDPAEKALTPPSKIGFPEQLTPHAAALPLRPPGPKGILTGDPQAKLPLLEPSFDKQPGQASSVPSDTTPQPLPDLGTSDSSLTLGGDRPEIDVSEAATTRSSIQPNRRQPVIAEPVEPDPLTPSPAYPPQPAIQGSLEPPKLNDLQPHLPGEVGNAGRSLMDTIESAHAPDQPPPIGGQQISPGRDENTQSLSSPIRPAGYFDEPTPTPALIPAAPVRLPAVESLNANYERGSRRNSGPPTIKVAIGRIEVRAETAPPPPQPAPQITTRRHHQPKLSLADYLRKRNEGG